MAALSFPGPLHRAGAGIPAGTDEMCFVRHLLTHGASWRTFDFLGFHQRMVDSFSKPGVRFLARWPSARAMQAARTRIREITDRRRLSLPVEDVVTELNRFLAGWGGYFRRGNSTRMFDKIDHYAFDRVARLLGGRHQSRRPIAWGRGLLARRRHLIPRRLVGTIRYGPAHATR